VVGGSPEGIDIGEHAEAGMLTILLKWRIAWSEHRGHLAGLASGEFPGCSEVDKHCPVVCGHHDVFGLDVAVDHISLVHHCKGTCYLLDKLHKESLFKGAAFFDHLE